MERKTQTTEVLYSSSEKPDKSLKFWACLPGLADRTLLQRLVWRVYYHPLLRFRIYLQQNDGFEIKERDDWVTLEYKRFMRNNTPIQDHP